MPETVLKQGNILIVDDEKTNVRLLEITNPRPGKAHAGIGAGAIENFAASGAGCQISR